MHHYVCMCMDNMLIFKIIVFSDNDGICGYKVVPSPGTGNFISYTLYIVYVCMKIDIQPNCS